MESVLELDTIYQCGATYTVITKNADLSAYLVEKGWTIENSVQYKDAVVCTTTERNEAVCASQKFQLPIVRDTI